MTCSCCMSAGRRRVLGAFAALAGAAVASYNFV